MASKEAAASLTAGGKTMTRVVLLRRGRKPGLAKHRDKLIRRVPTMDVVDQLIPRRAIDIDMDVYQRIRACHEELRNDRARLLLDYVASHTQKIFWDFQEALSLVSCEDLAIRREDVDEVAESFSAMELSAAAAPCQPKKPRPASVENVIEELKSRYRKREGSFSGWAHSAQSRVSRRDSREYLFAKRGGLERPVWLWWPKTAFPDEQPGRHGRLGGGTGGPVQ